MSRRVAGLAVRMIAWVLLVVAPALFADSAPALAKEKCELFQLMPDP